MSSKDETQTHVIDLSKLAPAVAEVIGAVQAQMEELQDAITALAMRVTAVEVAKADAALVSAIVDSRIAAGN